MIDLYIFILIFFLFLGVTFPGLFANQNPADEKGFELLYTLIGLAGYAVFETFCLNVFGRTFGKLVYGIHIRPKTGHQIELATAFKRSVAVWIRGLGFGIPLIALITLIVAYRTLHKERETSWDRDFKILVTHDRLSVFRWVGVAVTWALMGLYYRGW